MQPILITTQYPDLYHFLNAMVLEVTTKKADSFVIWSPETQASLLDSRDKLDLVDHYAHKLGVKMVLSAANDPQLRALAQEVGWTVLWDIPGLDQALSATPPQYRLYQIEDLIESGDFEESIAS